MMQKKVNCDVYADMRDRLIMRLCRCKESNGVMFDVPYKKIGDMALIYQVVVEEYEKMMKTVTVDNSMLKSYGITVDELHKDATISATSLLPMDMFSMDKIMRIAYTNDIVNLNMPAEIKEVCLREAEAFLKDVSLGNKCMILTNKQKKYGASVLFYPGMTESLSEKMNGSYYVFPSSVHEMILCAEEIGDNLDNIIDITAEVNQHVSPEEVLSDTVYHYDAEDKIFETAEEYASRKGKVATEKEEKYFDIHVKYGFKDSDGYSIPVIAINEDEALCKARMEGMFEFEEDELCVEDITEIGKEEYEQMIC